MHIYDKSVNFVRGNPKSGAKLAIPWEMIFFDEALGSSMPSLPLTPNVEP
jgi:hypothetical protein